MTHDWLAFFYGILGGVNAAFHGEEKSRKYNFPLSIFGVALLAWLLWMGGWWETRT